MKKCGMMKGVSVTKKGFKKTMGKTANKPLRQLKKIIS